MVKGISHVIKDYGGWRDAEPIVSALIQSLSRIKNE